jgi:hypothetical protein
MTTNIEKICNYSEDTKNPYQPSISISYIDMITEDEDAQLRELKRENRELAIDIILDEKDESEWENRNNLPNTGFSSGYTSTISPKIFTVNTRAQKFTSFKDLECEVFNKLEILTKNVPSSIAKLAGNTLNLNIPTDNDSEAFRRRVLTKITMCSNFIAMESGKGIANTVIVGRNAIQYVQSYEQIIDNNNTSILGGMNLIVSNYIDPDKVIVMRCENTPGVGLNVIFKPNDLVYYMVETPQSWEKTIKWFWIK